ncbi:MAG TPA: coenzyme F420-0:L-glutamate ligase, partial [Nitrososphaerales archaeon]
MKNGEIRIVGIRGIPEISKGDDIGAIIADALEQQVGVLKEDDIVVVTQKIVSKAEGRVRALDSYKPSKRAIELAAELGKDSKHVQAILEESRRILRAERGIIIAETKHGLICANAGIDQSNVKPNMISMLPEDPDASARNIRNGVKKKTGVSVAVIISDTF